jgi:hypothetical protein
MTATEPGATRAAAPGSTAGGDTYALGRLYEDFGAGHLVPPR